jgi:hypothetical protein
MKCKIVNHFGFTLEKKGRLQIQQPRRILGSSPQIRRAEDGLVPISAGNMLHGDIYNISNSIFWVVRRCVYLVAGGFFQDSP